MTKHTEQLIVMLSTAETDNCIDFGGLRIVPEPSHNGCSGCIFQTEEKANGCIYKCVCMAHLRKDCKSLVFTSKMQEL